MDAHEESWINSRIASLTPEAAWKPDPEAALHRFQTQRARIHSRRRRARWIAAALALASGIVLAAPTGRAFAGRCVDACGAVVRSLLSAPADPALRAPAPDFTLSTATGAQLTLSTLQGRVVVVNFWATWCPPCLAEIPLLAEIRNAHPAVEVLGVSVDEGGWTALRPFLARHPVEYPILAPGAATAETFGIQSLPATVVVDKRGRIAWAHSGIVGKAALQARIKSLLAEW